MPSFTKQIIMQSFQQMLEPTPFDKITVSALTKAASIGHNTFYYHYEDIYALLNAWLVEVLGPYTKAETEGDWRNNIKAMLHACKDNSRVVYHIFNSLSRDRLERYVFSATDDVFYQYICQQAADREIPEERLLGITKICRYAIFGFYLEFLWNNMSADIDASVDQIADLFTGIVESALSQSQEP